MTLVLLFLFLLYGVALSAVLALAGYRSSATVPDGGLERGGSRRGRVLIVGATGGTGRQLVAQALDLGHEVTAFVRDPSKLGIEHPRLTVVEGDVLDYGSVEAAVRGQEAVVSALGHKRYFGPTRILSKGTRNVLRAMEAQGVRRFVCETSLGIGDSAGRMGLYYTFLVIPIIVPFYFWDKTRQERLIARSNLEWVIVRPGALTDAGKRGRVRHGRHVGSYLRTVRVSRTDVADFMLHQLESDAYLRTATEVAW
jgi:putative NADH-flavin reductase